MTTKKQEMRKCRLCGEKKTIDKFEIDKRVKGGRTSRCKACKAGLNDKSDNLYRKLKQRSKEDGQPLEVTRKELRGLLAAFDGKCIYCNATEEETGHPHHVDHVIAVSIGGRHHISNLVVACASCNSSKSNTPFLDFYIRKKSEIKDDNFSALIHYIAILSGQPTDEVLKAFIVDYQMDYFKHLYEETEEDESLFEKSEFKQIMKEALEEHIKTERAS